MYSKYACKYKICIILSRSCGPAKDFQTVTMKHKNMGSGLTSSSKLAVSLFHGVVWLLEILIKPGVFFHPDWDIQEKVTALRTYSSKRWKQKLIDFVDSDSDHFEQPAIDKSSLRGGIKGFPSQGRKQATDVSISNKHSTTRQKQERVLTVMPIDRSALLTVRETSWAIGFVRRQTCSNCKELQTLKRTTWVNTNSLFAVAKKR